MRTAAQRIVTDKPYVFHPPYPGMWWPWFLQQFAQRRLRRQFGITDVQVSGLEHLDASRKAGHGILLTPNHCHPADPFVVMEMARQGGFRPHVIASAHLFMQDGFRGKFQAWALRRAGVFSIYREGNDRRSLDAATDILAQAKRPLVLFPEGVISRSNDRLNALMEGTTLITRKAAKERAGQSPPGKVVVHPIGIRYLFRGDIRAALEPTLEELEDRLWWQPQRKLPLVERITKIGTALLSLKEIEFLGEPHNGTIQERVERLINHLLAPIEQEWCKGRCDGTVVDRVKRLRVAVLPTLIQRDKNAEQADEQEEASEKGGAGDPGKQEAELTPEERNRRWRQLDEMTFAQQLSCYPPNYLKSNPTPERMLETVERFEEDLTGDCRPYGPIAARVRVGEAIEAPTAKPRRGEPDPVLAPLEQKLKELIPAQS